MDFLQLTGKTVLVFGVANRKSVAYHTGQLLSEAGAKVVYSVRSEERRSSLSKLLGDAPIYVCDVERQEQIDLLRETIAEKYDQIHGIVHSIAFADYSTGWLPFHETPRKAFLQAVDISCFSLTAISDAFKELLDKQNKLLVAMRDICLTSRFRSFFVFQHFPGIEDVRQTGRFKQTVIL